MIASVSASTVAYCAGVSTLRTGAALVFWTSAKAASPSSDSQGSSATAPAPAPSVLRAVRRVTGRAFGRAVDIGASWISRFYFGLGIECADSEVIHEPDPTGDPASVRGRGGRGRALAARAPLGVRGEEGRAAHQPDEGRSALQDRRDGLEPQARGQAGSDRAGQANRLRRRAGQHRQGDRPPAAERSRASEDLPRRVEAPGPAAGLGVPGGAASELPEVGSAGGALGGRLDTDREGARRSRGPAAFLRQGRAGDGGGDGTRG